MLVNLAVLLVGDYKLLGSFWTNPHRLCSKFQNLSELVHTWLSPLCTYPHFKKYAISTTPICPPLCTYPYFKKYAIPPTLIHIIAPIHTHHPFPNTYKPLHLHSPLPIPPLQCMSKGASDCSRSR